jgi:wyosine [tRNA(Phe)-imidazoG37] synthetase (radical SAM superfamily)
MLKEPFQLDDIVKTCSKLTSGLNLSIRGLRACTRGALMPPMFCSPDELAQNKISKDTIIEKRKHYIQMLNDEHSEMDCKNCLMVEHKRYGDITFSQLGHIDLQHYSVCNLRCTYCNYTRQDEHFPPQYDALQVLRLFSSEDVQWNAHVDFAGGEPTLLDNIEEYLSFFRNRRIRVLMHTNAVRFHKAIYDGLADGSIYWVTTSLDAGTPSTYKSLRGRDHYLQVLENLSRYAVAGSKGKGMLSVKYIFCESNCGDDDITGFAYAMLALRPQKVWLTFDFSPLFLHQRDHDYSKKVEAYAKLYLLLKKHGIEAFHYYKEAIATVSQDGKDIMNRILLGIEKERSATALGVPDLIFKDFRNREPLIRSEPDKFFINPLGLKRKDGISKEWSLAGKRVLLAPACPLTQKLLSNPEIQHADWIGFIDRNPIQQGKMIEGRSIYSYEGIPSLGVDVILLVPPEKHRLDILEAIACNTPASVQIAELE